MYYAGCRYIYYRNLLLNVHTDSIGRYEPAPLFTLLLNAKWEARLVSAVGRGLGSDPNDGLNWPHPNGAVINQTVQNHLLKV